MMGIRIIQESIQLVRIPLMAINMTVVLRPAVALEIVSGSQQTVDVKSRDSFERQQDRMGTEKFTFPAQRIEETDIDLVGAILTAGQCPFRN